MTLAGAEPAVRADTQGAREHYDRATADFGLGHYADAAAEYEAAFGLRPDPALLYNSAQSYRLAGNKARAAELYRNYVRLYGDSSNAEDARRHLNDLESLIAAEPATPVAPPVSSEPAAPADNGAAPATSAPNLALAPPPAVAPSPQSASEASGTERPLYRRPWFWIAIGAAVAGGTVAILLATTRDRDPTATLGRFPVN